MIVRDRTTPPARRGAAGWWGIRILTGPDSWWFGDERGPYTMDQATAERFASLMNIRSNEMYVILRAYRSKPFNIDEHTNPRVSDPPPPGARDPGPVFARDMPHYRYAAAPLHRAPPHPPGTEVKRLLLPAETDRPGHNPGQQTRKRREPPRRRSC